MAKVSNNNTIENKNNSSLNTQRSFTRKDRILWLCGFISIMTVLFVVIIICLKYNYSSTLVINVVANETDFQQESALLLNETSNSDQNFELKMVSDPNANLTLSPKLKLVSRLEWVAQPSVEKLTTLGTPVPYVLIHHTATENCSSQAQCVFHVRFIQNFHIEGRNWWDIGYNFLVGGDGEAYEGRGWKSEGAHTFGYNSNSIGIAFIGTFNSIKPPKRQIAACKLLISKGVELGYIKKDYKLLAVRQLQTTQSPGEKLYEEIKTWDNWSPAP